MSLKVDFRMRWAIIFGQREIEPLEATTDRRVCRAAMFGDVNSVRKHVQMDKRQLDQRDPFGCTPLIYAVFFENISTTKTLLEEGADPNAYSLSEAFQDTLPAGATSLWIAANSSNLTLCKTLIRYEGIAKPDLDDVTHSIIKLAKRELRKEGLLLVQTLQCSTSINVYDVFWIIAEYV